MAVTSDQLHLQARALAPGLVASLVRGLGPFVLCVILAFILQAFIKPQLQAYTAKLVLDIGVNIILAVSLTMVNGFTGQFSMGHAGFLAIGGYAAGIVSYYGSMRAFGSPDVAGGALSGMPIRSPQGLPWFTAGDMLFFTSLLVGGLTAAVLGFLVGLPSLRLRGDYLAIVTLGFGEIVRVMITRTGPVLSPFRLSDASSPLNGQLVVNIADASSQPSYILASEIPISSAITGTGGISTAFFRAAGSISILATIDPSFGMGACG
jgi:ABC-type branched-subunit amino acid transport system permease subunit